MKRKLWASALAAGLILAGCGDAEEADTTETQETQTETVQQPEAEVAEEKSTADDFVVPFDGQAAHVHGMGHIEGDGLYFASHHGLKIYREGSWFETDGMRHDYMGFNAVDNGFFTSGHPEPSADMVNPIGIQRSTDGGRSLEHLGFSGETDFHAMAAGYRNHHLFVMNPQKNSAMEAGFYRSENEGKDWTRVEANGLDGELSALALHPDDSQKVAAATSTGVYLSEDGGANFSALTEEAEFGTAVFFAEDALYYASFENESKLQKYTLETEEKEGLPLPELTEDGVVFISATPEELAVYTVKGQAYVSDDEAANWTQIMKDGQVQ